MERLARMNRTVVFVGTLALVLLGLFLHGLAGGIVLLALAAAVFVMFTRTMFTRTSPRRPLPTRLVQGLIVGGLIGVALAKIT